MTLRLETRGSTSSWIDCVWTCDNERVSTMTSVAGVHVGLVFWERDGVSYAGVTGPETAASVAPVPQGAVFHGIDFPVGTSLRGVPAATLVDGGIELPDTTRRTFRLDGTRWRIPGPDDAEALVDRLVRSGTLVRDRMVTEVVRGRRPDGSPRTVERRFRAATGLTQGAIRQVERARLAATSLAAGADSADVVVRFGFFDEPHLIRSLRRFIGRTPRQLRDGTGDPAALNLA